MQAADLQVCCPTSFTSLPNDLSPEGPAAVGVAHRINFYCLFQNLIVSSLFKQQVCPFSNLYMFFSLILCNVKRDLGGSRVRKNGGGT